MPEEARDLADVDARADDRGLARGALGARRVETSPGIEADRLHELLDGPRHLEVAVELEVSRCRIQGPIGEFPVAEIELRPQPGKRSRLRSSRRRHAVDTAGTVSSI